MRPTVFIVILNWNGLSDTLECLTSLQKVDYSNFQIIVVDNASDKNEGAKIKGDYPDIHLVRNKENKGFAEGNNVGVRHALGKRADYILLLNNDTVVAPDFLRILVDYAEKHSDVGIVGPKIFYYNSDKIWFNGTMFYPWFGLFRHLEFGVENKKSKVKKPSETDYISGCALLIKREVIEKIGLLYAPFFAYFEEADWCFRARKLGFKSVVIPKSVIWHKVAASAGVLGENTLSPFQAYYYARNSRIFAKRNLVGFEKKIFIFAQYTFALVYNLLRCQNNKACIAYLKGSAVNIH